MNKKPNAARFEPYTGTVWQGQMVWPIIDTHAGHKVKGYPKWDQWYALSFDPIQQVCIAHALNQTFQVPEHPQTRFYMFASLTWKDKEVWPIIDNQAPESGFTGEPNLLDCYALTFLSEAQEHVCRQLNYLYETEQLALHQALQVRDRAHPETAPLEESGESQGPSRSEGPPEGPLR